MADISQITIPVKNPSTGVVTRQTYNLKSENVSLIAECSTARSTAAKTVALTGFTLTTGVRIIVRFTDTGSSNPASGNLTLEVNGTGAKEIVDGHTANTVLTYSNASYFYNNYVAEFVYDGTHWVWLNRDKDTTYTGGTLKTNAAKTGTAQSSVTTTIAKSTTMDNAIGTLLNNDKTLESDVQTLTNNEQATRDSIAPTEDGTNYSTTYYKGDEFYRNGTLYKVTASSVNSSTAINTASGGNAKAADDITTQISKLTDKKACRVYVLSYTKSDMTESTWSGLYAVENDSKTIDTSMFDTIDGELVTVRFLYGSFQATNCGVNTSLSPSSSHAVHLELYRPNAFPTASYTIMMTIVLYGTLK